MGYVITIDGPAASGKSSVSRELSRILNIPWVSTGAFYRGLAFAAICQNIELTNKLALSELAAARRYTESGQAVSCPRLGWWPAIR